MIDDAGGPWLHPEVIICDRCGSLLRFADAAHVPVKHAIQEAGGTYYKLDDWRCCQPCAKKIREGGKLTCEQLF